MAPEPSLTYLSQASSCNGATDNRKLVILDLNGTLLCRALAARSEKSVYEASRNPIPRPGLHNFLKYIFANFSVMVFSSSKPHNVQAMLSAIMNEEQKKALIACWTRVDMKLTKHQFDRKVQTYKNLDTVWEKIHHDSTGKPVSWSQYNTIIVDDSKTKCAAHPYNHIAVSDFVAKSHSNIPKDIELACVIRYLKHLKSVPNVSYYIYKFPFKILADKSLEDNLKYLDELDENYKKECQVDNPQP